QVEVAKELNDPERVINREIKLKELYLDANGQNFELSKLPTLRAPEEWAAMKSFTGKAKKAEMASSFLEWTSEPIHKSLTDVSGLKGEAKKQFKNLLGYCGDRKYQYPDPLIRDIVAKGVEMEQLRGELYVHAMKQLTKNPNPASVQRCWEMVTMLLTCFPPPKDLENYVHYFVRCNAPSDTREKFKLAVHMSVYDGVKTTAPSVKDIPPLLSGFFEREISAR
ncbi:unnamed protein product, partial [Hapterophycus canaliculatus]